MSPLKVVCPPPRPRPTPVVPPPHAASLQVSGLGGGRHPSMTCSHTASPTDGPCSLAAPPRAGCRYGQRVDEAYDGQAPVALAGTVAGSVHPRGRPRGRASCRTRPATVGGWVALMCDPGPFPSSLDPRTTVRVTARSARSGSGMGWALQPPVHNVHRPFITSICRSPLSLLPNQIKTPSPLTPHPSILTPFVGCHREWDRPFRMGGGGFPPAALEWAGLWKKNPHGLRTTKRKPIF